MAGALRGPEQVNVIGKPAVSRDQVVEAAGAANSPVLAAQTSNPSSCSRGLARRRLAVRTVELSGLMLPPRLRDRSGRPPGRRTGAAGKGAGLGAGATSIVCGNWDEA